MQIKSLFSHANYSFIKLIRRDVDIRQLEAATGNICMHIMDEMTTCTKGVVNRVSVTSTLPLSSTKWFSHPVAHCLGFTTLH